MIENQSEEAKKKIMLGYSKKYSLNYAGCLVHCVARILNLPVLEVHEKLKKGGCFYADATGDICLLGLDYVQRVFPQIKYFGKKAYDVNLMKEYITKYGIVIIEVDYNPIMEGTQQHFVCATLQGIEDPLGGVLRAKDFYKSIISIRPFDLPVNENTMTTEEKNILDFLKLQNANEGKVREAFGCLADNPNKDKKIKELETYRDDLTNANNILVGKVKSEQDLALLWQTHLKTANATNQKISEELGYYKPYKALYEAKCLQTVDKLSIKELINYLLKRIIKNDK